MINIQDSRHQHNSISGSFNSLEREERNTTILSKLTSTLQQSSRSVLPDTLAEMRENVRVMMDLGIKTHPMVNLENTIQARRGRDQKEIFDTLIEPFKLSGEISHQDTALLYVDKMRPHAKLDLMVTQCDHTIAPRYEDLSQAARQQILQDIVNFMRYCKEASLTPVCSYSVDPLTYDRKSAQSSKRFHVHFIAREADEVRQIFEKSHTLSRLDIFAQRRLVDETAIVLGNVFAEKIQGIDFEGIERITPPFGEGKGFPFLKFHAYVPRNEEESTTLSESITKIHKLYESAYWDIRDSFFQGESGLWLRPRKLASPLSENSKLSYLSEGTRDALSTMVSSFSSRLLDIVEAAKPGNDLGTIVSHIYPNSCPAYSVTMTNQNPDRIEITFRPFLFSDTGGAGLSSLSNIVVKTAKLDEQCLTQDEMKERREFQREVLLYLKVPQR